MTFSVWGASAARSAAVLMLVSAFIAAVPASAGEIGAIGDVYASDSYAGGLYQYDGATGDFVGQFAGRGTRTFAAHAWGPDGHLYAVTTVNLNRWDVDRFDGNTGEWLGTVVQHLNDGSPSVGKGLAFGPDGDLYVGDWYRQRVSRYEAGTFDLKDTYQGGPGTPLGTPTAMRFAPSGNLLVISGGFNQVVEFDTSDGGIELLGTFATLNASQSQDLTFGPNGNLFVASDGIMEFDGSSGDFLGYFVAPDPTLGFQGLVFDNYGRLLVSTSGSSPHAWTIVMYDGLTGDFLGDFYAPGTGGGGEDGAPGYLSIKPIPEPAAMGLLIVGTLALLRRRASLG